MYSLANFDMTMHVFNISPTLNFAKWESELRAVIFLGFYGFVKILHDAMDIYICMYLSRSVYMY
jgi:hypothetical protein